MHDGPESAGLPGLPAEPGTYALLLRCSRPLELVVGGLGAVRLLPGYCVYVGSALGPGGLRARLARHLGPVKRFRWHIDHLRARARLVEIWFSVGSLRREHLWANVLAGMAAGLVKGFGASDCRCASHLLYFSGRPSLSGFARNLRKEDPAHPSLERRTVTGSRQCR